MGDHENFLQLLVESTVLGLHLDTQTYIKAGLYLTKLNRKSVLRDEIRYQVDTYVKLLMKNDNRDAEDQRFAADFIAFYNSAAGNRIKLVDGPPVAATRKRQKRSYKALATPLSMPHFDSDQEQAVSDDFRTSRKAENENNLMHLHDNLDDGTKGNKETDFDVLLGFHKRMQESLLILDFFRGQPAGGAKHSGFTPNVFVISKRSVKPATVTGKQTGTTGTARAQKLQKTA